MNWNRNDNDVPPHGPTGGDWSHRGTDLIIAFFVGGLVGVALTFLVGLLP